MIGLLIGTLIQILTLVINGTPANPTPGGPGNGNPTQGGTTTGTTNPTQKPPGGTGSWDDNG